MCSAPRRSLPLVSHRKNITKGMCFPKKPKQLKIWYTTAGHRLAVIAWLMLVKTLFFLGVEGKYMVYAKVFRRYWQHFVFFGKHNGFAWFSMTEWSVKICHAKVVSGLKYPYCYRTHGWEMPCCEGWNSLHLRHIQQRLMADISHVIVWIPQWWLLQLHSPSVASSGWPQTFAVTNDCHENKILFHNDILSQS